MFSFFGLKRCASGGKLLPPNRTNKRSLCVKVRSLAPSAPFKRCVSCANKTETKRSLGTSAGVGVSAGSTKEPGRDDVVNDQIRTVRMSSEPSFGSKFSLTAGESPGSNLKVANLTDCALAVTERA